MSSRDLQEDGWFVALEDRQHGPVSASDAWQLVAGIKAETSVQVWHPLLPQWQSLSSTLAAHRNAKSLPENGWFVASESERHGPMSASDACQFVADIKTETLVHVWHPLLPRWQALPLAPTAVDPKPKDLTENGRFVASEDRQHPPISASGELAPDLRPEDQVHVGHPSERQQQAPPSAPNAPPFPKLNLDEFRLNNARYITWIAYGASPLFVLCAALARDVQDAAVSAIVVAVFTYFGWWLYLEHAGLRLLRTEIAFPYRIALWPFPALWIRRIRIADISGFECWSGGTSVHWFRLHTTGRAALVALDDTLHREILVLALEQRLPQSGTQSKDGSP